MGAFILQRLARAVVTIFGVMLLTFVLFRVVAGDISANYLASDASPDQRQRFYRQHALDRPLLVDATKPITSPAFWDSQFTRHLIDSVTLRATSYATGQSVGRMIAERAPYSLALTMPALAIGWLAALTIALLIAHYRNTWLDRLAVLLTTLGMCVPLLAYMIVGQWIVFRIVPAAAWGLRNVSNIYVPVAIAVLASIGGNVRLYRTIILDEITRDYVRTARAKGAPLSRVLLGHVLPNCMLPILTQLVMAIPFLIMGSLLLESFFGIPGLGGQLVTSISRRDVPIVTALTFVTAVLYVTGLLATDILYAVFDPRVRLKPRA